jgi:ABC-type sugar transport system permease subunit
MTSANGPISNSCILPDPPYLAYREAFQVYKYGVGAATAVIAVLIVLVMAGVYMRQVRAEQRA